MTTYPQADSGSFLPHMPDVARCELSLRELNQMWRLIEASAKMNCPAEARLLLPAMVATRTGFAHLEQALVSNLVQEKLRHVLADLGTQARYAIDILVRNLYERTADVGFLATDLALCRFVAGLDDDQQAARQRLADYRDKYTVYDQILLLDTAGRVLVQADPATPVGHSRDPLLAATLAADGYVETFRATDLRPGQPRALVYSHRMAHPDSGAPAGVLCLCFHFEQELDAIFAAYRDPSQRANMLLLDADDRVISSADPLWIPPGARVPTNADGQPRPLMFGGREYLVRTCGAAGYQGYPGPPGWKAQLMAPLELAFRGHGAQALAGVAPELMRGLLAHAQAFSPALHELMGAVTRTTRTIERIVWNGKVTSAANHHADGADGQLNTVLDQITETGQRSDAVFSRAIEDLYQTVLASSLGEAGMTARLLVDLLDRNLYERANDCRWWALSAPLREGLARPSAPGARAMGALLNHINRLYTVYARLVVYDRGGRVVACSGDDAPLGQHIGADTLARVVALRDPLAHHPEPFGPSPFYGGQATYTYHAAIRAPGAGGAVLGGIGIVFDAAPELRNMLLSGVAGRAHLRACFVTPDGRVVAGTDPAHRPGATLALEPGLLAEAANNDGASVTRIVRHDGQYLIAACARAAGYREFRAADGVEQPVLALLLQAFGAAPEAAAPAPRAGVAIERAGDAPDGGPDFAIFHAGGALMALRAAHIQEALPAARVQRTASAAHPARVGMLDVAPAGGGQRCVWVFDLALLVGGRPGVIGDDSQVMLVRHADGVLGLLVDDLHSVRRFDAADLTDSPLSGARAALAPRLIQANQGRLLIEELCVERLLARLRA
ncbi:chemotaxis signal transduction protein [Duganella sp. SG902]|uniref:chemotaxis protein CheW n=1 Tax=Duganella sp. SG902 TaxID=2587016 RepID=UPI00159E87C6|nr:chemotaxis protein CheW [Duganella sp. SG902]NVM75705.1 chemotaxis signal transduction protein [Duganella sp. SG902]